MSDTAGPSNSRSLSANVRDSREVPRVSLLKIEEAFKMLLPEGENRLNKDAIIGLCDKFKIRLTPAERNFLFADLKVDWDEFRKVLSKSTAVLLVTDNSPSLFARKSGLFRIASTIGRFHRKSKITCWRDFLLHYRVALIYAGYDANDGAVYCEFLRQLKAAYAERVDTEELPFEIGGWPDHLPMINGPGARAKVEAHLKDQASFSSGPTESLDAIKTLDQMRDKLRTGDMVVFSARTSTGLIIKTATNSIFSHVGLIVKTEGTETGDEFGPSILSYEATNNHTLPDAVHNYQYPGLHCFNAYQRIIDWPGDVWIAPLDPPFTPEQEEKALQRIRSYHEGPDGKPKQYDVEQLPLAGVDNLDSVGGATLNVESDDKLFCSEFVAFTLKASGIPRFEKVNASEETPDDNVHYLCYPKLIPIKKWNDKEADKNQETIEKINDEKKKKLLGEGSETKQNISRGVQTLVTSS